MFVMLSSPTSALISASLGLSRLIAGLNVVPSIAEASVMSLAANVHLKLSVSNTRALSVASASAFFEMKISFLL